MNIYEKIRKSYKPKSIKVLYIGESRPANGTFFYKGDSILFRAIKNAFQEAYGRSFANDISFLDYFKTCGCYLEDLCIDPVNKLPGGVRLQKREQGIPRLANSIKHAQPEAIIILMKDIKDDVVEAIKLSGVDLKYGDITPFPGRPRNTENCIRENAEHLRKMKEIGII